ncbi:hypothetical protein [Agrococcus sp. SGAir0287]|uniref:hypothetical protein n=1 Tax=Agrococcus sp. SGAir0287 TaxID=2070347 RepID=UPI0010CD45D8|nr:hypothetical protein [Agrococcus sp. SGAir0287]QCR18302.1 hypothetical protein C1N71_01600 [Agrococcus sp. SGAir0287]
MDADDAVRAQRAESPLRVVALMVLSLALVVALATLGLLPLFVVSQPCPVDLQPCETIAAPIAFVLLLIAPAAAVVVGIVGGAIQLARRRRAIRWPAIACAVAVALWLAGLVTALVAAS